MNLSFFSSRFDPTSIWRRQRDNSPLLRVTSTLVSVFCRAGGGGDSNGNLLSLSLRQQQRLVVSIMAHFLCTGEMLFCGVLGATKGRAGGCVDKIAPLIFVGFVGCCFPQ